MKTKEVEYAIYNHFINRYPLITTNITYLSPFFYHECDILMASKANILTEIEIKVSISDLKADFKKRHQHKCKGIKFQYFAIPSDMATDEAIKLIPENFGILVVYKKEYREIYLKKIPVIRTSYLVREYRKPKKNPDYTGMKLDDKQLINLYRLSGYRYWTGKLRELKYEGLYMQRKEM